MLVPLPHVKHRFIACKMYSDLEKRRFPGFPPTTSLFKPLINSSLTARLLDVAPIVEGLGLLVAKNTTYLLF